MQHHGRTSYSLEGETFSIPFHIYFITCFLYLISFSFCQLCELRNPLLDCFWQIMWFRVTTMKHPHITLFYAFTILRRINLDASAFKIIQIKYFDWQLTFVVPPFPEIRFTLQQRPSCLNCPHMYLICNDIRDLMNSLLKYIRWPNYL